MLRVLDVVFCSHSKINIIKYCTREQWTVQRKQKLWIKFENWQHGLNTFNDFLFCEKLRCRHIDLKIVLFLKSEFGKEFTRFFWCFWIFNFNETVVDTLTNWTNIAPPPSSLWGDGTKLTKHKQINNTTDYYGTVVQWKSWPFFPC